MSEIRSLHRKLTQVMYEAERIPKNGTAPAAMGGFKFVQVGDAADVIRKALAEQKVSMIPTAIEIVDQTEHPSGQDGKKVMTTMTVRTTWTLTDADSGESTVIQSLGSGGDTGDKAAPKAQSNAMKYALLMGFLLSTGDDPEQTDTSDRQTGRPAPEHLPSREPIPPREGSLLGVAEAAKPPHDFELRQTPEGPSLGFALKEDRAVIRVLTYGQLAEEIAAFREAVEGKRLTCYGSMTDESWTVNAGRANERSIPYTRLLCTRLTGADGLALPMPTEAASLPLFSPEEQVGLDAAIGAA